LIQQTTLEAWGSVQLQLGARQQLIYAAITVMGGATNLQLSKHLGLPINSVTPRVLELRKLGMIQEGEVIMQETGRSAIKWKPI
jgi:predicted transcriptional regulator